MADKMVPVVATADGVIDWVHDGDRKRCCALGLLHDDGWESWYIHMNNDTPGTDDGQAWGFAPGIEEGTRVTAGQLIGWVGDSGNAEGTEPHIHFELHRPDGTPINPYQPLLDAIPADLTDSDRAIAALATAITAADFSEPVPVLFVVAADSYDHETALATIGETAMPTLVTTDTGLSARTWMELRRLEPDHIIIVGDGVSSDIAHRMSATLQAEVRFTQFVESAKFNLLKG